MATHLFNAPVAAHHEKLPNWAQPQSWTFPNGQTLTVTYEQGPETDCGPATIFYRLTTQTGELLDEQDALTTCGDTHFEGFSLNIPMREKDQIVFYRYWNYWGLDGGTPVGAMRVAVDMTGPKPVIADARIYLEPGYQYGGLLFRHIDLTEEEQAERAEHIAVAEEAYMARFVEGNARTQLFLEVERALASHIRQETHGWCATDHPQNRKVAGADIGLTPCDD